MDSHKAQARALGARRVEAEKRLDALFASGKVEEESLADAVRAAGAVEAEYRLSHLDTHRRMHTSLTDEQVRRYNELRGYGSGGGTHKH